MVHFQIKNNASFCNILTIIRNIQEHVSFDCDPVLGVNIQGVTDCYSGMINVILPPEYFEIYECKTNINLMINVKKVLFFIQASKFKDNNDIITLQCDSENTGLNISVNINSGKKLKEFNLVLTPYDEKENKKMDITLYGNTDCNIVMLKKDFYKLIRDGFQLGCNMQFSIYTINRNQREASFVVQTDTEDKYTTKYKNDKQNQVQITLSNKQREKIIKGTFALYTIHMLSKCPFVQSKLKTMRWSMVKESASMIEYEIENTNNKGKINYYISPKMAEMEE